MQDVKNPKLLVFAGPNGSGKSTITKRVKPVGTYVNADDIKATTGCSDLKAAQTAEIIRERLLSAGLDFTFETVLSTERNLLLIKKAKEKGYNVCVIFVLTADSSINVQRVQSRVAGGGHPVPTEKIISRYERSLANVSELVRTVDMLRIIDNTSEIPCEICKIVDGMVTIQETEYWTKKRIFQLLFRKNTEHQ